MVFTCLWPVIFDNLLNLGRRGCLGGGRGTVIVKRPTFKDSKSCIFSSGDITTTRPMYTIPHRHSDGKYQPARNVELNINQNYTTNIFLIVSLYFFSSKLLIPSDV